MHPQPKKARKHLLDALAALQDPVAHCKKRGHEASNYAQARDYAVGAATSCIEFALQALGEPIDPYRAIGEPYPADQLSAQQTIDEGGPPHDQKEDVPR